MRNVIGMLAAMSFGLVWLALALAAAAAWLTHVVYCIMEQMWVLLVIGAFIAPIGAIHGVMIWLGMV